METKLIGVVKQSRLAQRTVEKKSLSHTSKCWRTLAFLWDNKRWQVWVGDSLVVIIRQQQPKKEREMLLFSLSKTRSWTMAFVMFASLGYVRQQKFFYDNIQDITPSPHTFHFPKAFDAAHTMEEEEEDYEEVRIKTNVLRRKRERLVSRADIVRPTVHDQEASLLQSFHQRNDPTTMEEQENPIVQQHTCKIGNQVTSFQQAPNVIIIGAQKAGTTQLADLLKEHPNMLSPKKGYELHYLDWMIPKLKDREQKRKELNLKTETELFCHYSKEYADSFDTSLLQETARNGSQLLAFEKTPSYMFHGYYLPDIVLRVCPWKPKLLAILRNPIDRAWSQFRMDRRQRHSSFNTTFEIFLNREITAMREFGISQSPTLEEWTALPTSGDFGMTNLTQDELDGAHKRLFRKVFLSNYLQRGMYAVQLQKWRAVFGPSLHVIRYEDLYGAQKDVQWERLLRFLEVPHMPMPDMDQRPDQKSLPENTRLFLERFFRPYNNKLEEILGEEWKEPWSLDRTTVSSGRRA